MALTRLLALTTLVWLVATPPARANCCHDFWSCAAAVATGGVSCAVQAAIDELERLKTRAENSKRAAQAERTRVVEILESDTRQQAAAAEADGRTRMNSIASQMRRTEDAHRRAFLAPGSNVIVARAVRADMQSLPASATTPKVTAAPTSASPTDKTPPQLATSPALAPKAPTLRPLAVTPPPRASDADVQAASEAAVARMKQISAEASAEKAKIEREDLARFRRIARASVDGMRTVFEASLIAPMVGLLASMPPPDPLLTAAVVAGIVAHLDRIERDGGAATAKKLAEVKASIKTETDGLWQALARQRERDDEAQKIAELSEQMLRTRTQADLDALRSALAPSREGSGVRTFPAALRLFEVSLRPVGAAAESAPAIATVPAAVSPTLLGQWTSQTQTELKNRLTGTSPGEVEKKRAALVAEARRRFAKDPKTRDAVIAYLASGTP